MIFEDEIDREKFNKISFKSKSVLEKYKKHLKEEIQNTKEREALLIYMINHDLNSNMIQFLGE